MRGGRMMDMDFEDRRGGMRGGRSRGFMRGGNPMMRASRGAFRGSRDDMDVRQGFSMRGDMGHYRGEMGQFRGEFRGGFRRGPPIRDGPMRGNRGMRGGRVAFDDDDLDF
jgi:hypothetical protein